MRFKTVCKFMVKSCRFSLLVVLLIMMVPQEELLACLEVELIRWDTTIEKANNYSENTHLVATVIYEDTKETVTDFVGTIKFTEEPATAYYVKPYFSETGTTELDPNEGDYEGEVNVSNGTAELTIKSLSHSDPADPGEPGPAQIRATAYENGTTEVANSGPTNPLTVPQWVDTGPDNGVDDWIDKRIDDITGTGEKGFVIARIGSYNDDLGSGQMSADLVRASTGTVNICPTGALLRLGESGLWSKDGHSGDVDNSFTFLYIHEARHCYQSYECNRNDVGSNDAEEDPAHNNDDDPDGDPGDWSPEEVGYASANDIRDICANGFSGDATADTYDNSTTGDVESARELDAYEWADANE